MKKLTINEMKWKRKGVYIYIVTHIINKYKIGVNNYIYIYSKKRNHHRRLFCVIIVICENNNKIKIKEEMKTWILFFILSFFLFVVGVLFNSINTKYFVVIVS